MEREILNLKEYDLIPLIDEYWNENEDYIELDDEGDYLQNETGFYVNKSGEWENYELIDTTLDYYNLEDGYEINNHVIKNLHDGKYFKFYSKYYYEDSIIIPNQAIYEVFPKKVEITIYE